MRAPDWWESARFPAVRVAWGWFRQNGVVSSHPPAGNARRWAIAKPCSDVLNVFGEMLLGFKNIMKKRIVYVLALMVLAVCYTALAIERYNYRKSWEAKTSPLPKETVSALCKNFSLSSNHRLCNDSRNVYALDFTEVLRDYFPLEDAMETPKSEATISNQDVDEVIGAYKTGCQEVVNAREFSYFRCFYDFRGDGYWTDAFYFYYPENTLFSIRSGSSDDS